MEFKNVAKFPSKNWPEDYPQENGCYQNRCFDCGELFLGNKHRRYCKECEIPSMRFWERLAKKEAPQDNKCAHAGCWADGEMVGFARCMVKEVKPLQNEVSEQSQRIQELTKENEQLKLESIDYYHASANLDIATLELSRLREERKELVEALREVHSNMNPASHYWGSDLSEKIEALLKP